MAFAAALATAGVGCAPEPPTELASGGAGGMRTSAAVTGGSGGTRDDGYGGELAVGGAGGGQATACDDASPCNNEPGSCPTCATSEGECTDEFEACENAEANACFEFAGCGGKCAGDAACNEKCRADFPDGAKQFEALLLCVWCDACPTSCSQFAAACGGEPSNEKEPCCKPHTTKGCSDAAIEACVCETDAYCCEDAWDQFCVERVIESQCGACG